MGACWSYQEEEVGDESNLGTTGVKSFRKPRWRSDEPMTEAELQAQRDEFWDTEPHYGGEKVIWDALRAACESDLDTAKVLLESAGVVVASEDMTICYDERGKRYKLEKYVLSAPTNLVRDRTNSQSGGVGGSSSSRRSTRGSGHMELPVMGGAT